MTGEKTEEPTDKKLEDAAKKGQLPQRKNVLEAFLLSMGVITIASVWQIVAFRVGNVFDVAFSGITRDFSDVVVAIKAAALQVVAVSLIMTCSFGIAILLLNLYLNKFNFAPGALTPKFEKLNPVNGLKGIFSPNTLYNFIRLLIYFSCVSLFLYLAISGNIKDVVNAASCGVTCLAKIFPGLILSLVIKILILLLIMAVLDFKLQTIMFRKQQKMTKDEVKREFKGAQGDPQIKGKRKELAQENVALPTARDVTHVIYAPAVLIAVMYVPGQTPFVVMKAKGAMVARLHQKFRHMGVHCVNIPSVALDFAKRYPVGNYMDAQAAIGMAKVLRATGEMD